MLVPYDDVPRLPGFPEQMKNDGVFRYLQIQVDLHAPVMGVAGHGVPERARRQLGEPHDQLAALYHAGMDELVDRPDIGIDSAPQFNLLRLGLRQLNRGMSGMSGTAGKVESGRIIRVAAAEGQFPNAHAEIEAFLVLQRVLSAVYHHHAGGADVDDAHFLRCRKKSTPVPWSSPATGAGQPDRPSHDDPVDVAVDHREPTLLEQPFKEQMFSDGIGIHLFQMVLMNGIANIHFRTFLQSR